MRGSRSVEIRVRDPARIAVARPSRKGRGEPPLADSWNECNAKRPFPDPSPPSDAPPRLRLRDNARVTRERRFRTREKARWVALLAFEAALHFRDEQRRETVKISLPTDDIIQLLLLSTILLPLPLFSHFLPKIWCSLIFWSSEDYFLDIEK